MNNGHGRSGVGVMMIQASGDVHQKLEENMKAGWRSPQPRLGKEKFSTIQEIFQTEELKGAWLCNQAHYLICGLFLTMTVIFRENNFGYNLAAVIFLVVMNGIQSWALACQRWLAIQWSSYFVLFIDIGLIFGLILLYTHTQGQSNYTFALKNLTYWFYVLILALHALHLRIGLVMIGAILATLVHFLLLALALRQGVQFTEGWFPTLMQGQVQLKDELTTRPMIILSLGGLMAYGIYRSKRMVRQFAEIQAQKQSLMRYFSPKVAQEITGDWGELSQGRRQKVTILFSDLRDFTKLTEQTDPHLLVEFLTEFRERMTQIIFEAEGSVDKFIGDAIMATFGTPYPAKEAWADSRQALFAGARMLEAIEALNIEQQHRGLPPLQIGIGIHTGEVIVGSVGRQHMLEYTVIGDAVNTASRIEGLCKQTSANFLISEEVYQETHAFLEAEPLPPVTVKGKEKPLQVYRVLKIKGSLLGS